MGGRLHIYDTYRAMHGVTQKKKSNLGLRLLLMFLLVDVCFLKGDIHSIVSIMFSFAFSTYKKYVQSTYVSERLTFQLEI